MIKELSPASNGNRMNYGPLTTDVYDGNVNYGPLFVRLAWRCASTHRVTDYTGGCNGARIRLSPQKDWPINAGLDAALALLAPVKEEFGDALSWADLIVLAGNTALEEAGAPKLPFCGGRTDASASGDAGVMEPLLDDDMSNSLDDLQESSLLLGVSPREFTALMGRRSIGQFHESRRGFIGSIDDTPLTLDNGYFQALTANMWEKHTVPTTSKTLYKTGTSTSSYALRSDVLLTLEPQFLTAAQDFASDNDMFLDEFAAAWTKVMNADRFSGPAGNLCEPYKSEEELEQSKCPMKNSKDMNEDLLLGRLVIFIVLFLVSMLWNLVQWRSGSIKDEKRGANAEMTTTGVQGQQNSPRGASRV